MPNESRICMICRSTYPKKKKKSVAGQFAAVKCRSETYRWTQKLRNREDYGGRQVYLVRSSVTCSPGPQPSPRDTTPKRCCSHMMHGVVFLPLRGVIVLAPPVPWCCDDVSDVIVSFLIPNPQHTVDDMYRCRTFTISSSISVSSSGSFSISGIRELRLCADEDLSRDKEKTNLFFWFLLFKWASNAYCDGTKW
jgi:hypothetical protein